LSTHLLFLLLFLLDIATTIPFLLFFQCHRPHRGLHSFPTRRSSDLPTLQAAYDQGVAPLLAGQIEVQEAFNRGSVPIHDFMAARSEERRVGKECRFPWSLDGYKEKKVRKEVYTHE